MEQEMVPQPKQSALQRGYLHANACLPLVVMVICLGVVGDIVLAVFVFQILCMVVMPLIYICCLLPNGVKTYELVLRRLCRDAASQWASAAAGFAACLVGGFGLFLLAQTEHVVDRNEVVSTAEADGINGSTLPQPWMAVALAVEFTFVNSGLEELFWRVYLYRELGGAHALHGSADLSTLLPAAAPANTYGADAVKGAAGDRGHGGSSDLESGLLAPQSGRARGGAWSLLGAAEAPKVLVSCYYASYHFVVMLCFVPWYLAVGGFGGLVVLGRVLVFCRESDRLGLVTGWGVHAGLDGAFCLIMAQLYLKFMR